MAGRRRTSSSSSHHFSPLDFWKSPKHACIHVHTCKFTTIIHDNMPQKLCMLSVLMGFRQIEGCLAFRFLLIFFLFTSSWATELAGLSYTEKVFIKEKEKKRREEQLLGLGRRTASGAQRYQSKSHLATAILVFQIKQPNLDK